MTVGELLAALQGVDLSLTVILQEDAEGNGFSPLAGAEPGYYVAESTWSGTVYGREDIDNGDAPDNGQTVIVLWPIN